MLIEQTSGRRRGEAAAGLPFAKDAVPDATPIEGQAAEAAAKQSYRDFYDEVTRRLEQTGVAEASFFLNYGYRSLGKGDEGRVKVPGDVFNANSVRLVFELIGPADLHGRRVLDVGCGRGGTAALVADRFATDVTGVDLSSAAIAFCRRTHGDPRLRFDVGDAEHLPCEDASFDVVTNIESSHTYPNLRLFFTEVSRVLAHGGTFLYTDLLPVARWMEVRALLGPLGLVIERDREITPNVLASCDEVAASRTKAFGGSNAAIDNFLAVPGSMVYEQMRSGAWEYRIIRATGHDGRDGSRVRLRHFHHAGGSHRRAASTPLTRRAGALESLRVRGGPARLCGRARAAAPCTGGSRRAASRRRYGSARRHGANPT